MTQDEWRAAVAADRPPLTPAQLAILRPLWRPVTTNAAPAATGTALDSDADNNNYSWRSNSEAV